MAATDGASSRYSSCSRAECATDIGVHLYSTGAYQIKTIWNGGEDGVQADVDRRRTPRQIDDQGMPAGSGGLARENGGRDLLQANATHQLTEPFQLPRDHLSRA